MSSLAGAGVGEIVLVAQDLAAYGRDIGAPGGLVELLRFVSDVEGLVRLRLYYLYPKEIRLGLIEEMASNPVIADYFDLSLQHVARPLLRAMKRPGDGERHLRLIADIREAAPEAALRSSFIVGFPGETESQVEELAGFLHDVGLDWAGFFPFSPEEGTPAGVMEGQIPQEEKAERLRYLQGIQDEITTLRNLDQKGRVVRVLVDQVEDGTSVARSYREAPEIDGVIVLDRGRTRRLARCAGHRRLWHRPRGRGPGQPVIVEVLAIGTELLLGQIVNTNAATIGGRLADAGLDHFHQSVVGDNVPRMAAAIELACTRSDALIITGGIGPTQDDLTREALSRAAGVAMEFSDQYAEELRIR